MERQLRRLKMGGFFDAAPILGFLASFLTYCIDIVNVFGGADVL